MVASKLRCYLCYNQRMKTIKDRPITDHSLWLEVITADPASWDVGTLRAHLDIEGVTGKAQERLVKVRLALDEPSRR
jgi:hypothetical protein